MAGASAFITESLLRGDAPLGPAALTFLVRRYATAGGDELRPALERGLTQALDRVAGGDSAPAWIHVLCEAAAVTDDERIVAAVADASRALRGGWPSRGSLLDATRSVDACLAAAILLDDRGFIGQTIDELERIVGLVYQPGERLPLSLRTPDEPDGGIEEHVTAASTLLTAHDLTARLPYSMLAEELIQPMRFDHQTGGVPIRCTFARVLGRLARLHDDEEYVRAAVVARSTDYRAEARTILEAVAHSVDANREDAALFAIVTDELARTS
jgi:hypothetical protein